MATDTLLLRMQTTGAGTVVAEIGRADAAVGRYDGSARRAHGATTMLGGAFRSLAGMVGIAGVGAGLIKAGGAFINFQAQMTKLQTQTGATKAEVASASKGILAMAASVGTGPQSLAEALYHIESTGKRGKEGLKVLETAALGAKVGNANLTDVTNALSSTIVSGIKGSGDYSKAMGMLNATVGAGDMTMQDLADAMHGTAVIAKSAGLALVDMGAALAVLGDNNIRGAKASNMLSMGLRVLMADSGPTAAAQGALGLKQNQLANELRKPHGLVGMLELLHVKLKDKSPAEQATAIMKIFGAKAGVGMLTLYNQMDRLKSKYGEIGKGAKRFGSDVDATKQTLAFYFGQFKAFAEVTLIRVGSALKNVIHWFKENRSTISTVLDVLRPFATVVAAALVTGKIISWGKAFGTLLAPIGKAITYVWNLGWESEATGAKMQAAGAKGATAFGGMATKVLGVVAAMEALAAYGALKNPAKPSQGIPGNPNFKPGITGTPDPGKGVDVLGVHVGGPGGDIISALGGAQGAIVTRPTLALIGEAGPEALIPLSDAPGASKLHPGIMPPQAGGFEVSAVTPIHIDGTQVGTALVKVGLRAKARS